MTVGKIRPVILAGGAGERLWPLSTESVPKQFMPISEGNSLFELTLKRVGYQSLFKEPIVVTLEKYIDQVLSSIKKTSIKSELIVLEPQGKNTCPALLTAINLQLRKNINEAFISLPSDHYIFSNEEFTGACNRAFNSLEENNLVLLGVEPKYPSTEFGYIQTSLKDSTSSVNKFIEKPNEKKAVELLKKGNVFWNAGIFIFKGAWFLTEIERLNKSLYEKNIRSIDLGKRNGKLFYPHRDSYKKIKDVSIDVALVEKTKSITMVQLEAGWSDLGSWLELSAHHNNPSIPISLYQESSIERGERPWGYYEVLKETKETKLKMIRVMPKQKLSLQKHKYRSEKWHITQGVATVTKGKDKITLNTGQSVIIEKNQIHSVENLEDFPLDFIEIQTGEYLGEDDIIRLQDIYGRANLN